MAGTAQRDRTGRDASGGHARSRDHRDGQFAVIQSMAPSLGVELSPVNVRDTGEIERAVAAFARSSNGGLIVTGAGGNGGTSRFDHHACGPAQLPADLFP